MLDRTRAATVCFVLKRLPVRDFAGISLRWGEPYCHKQYKHTLDHRSQPQHPGQQHPAVIGFPRPSIVWLRGSPASRPASGHPSACPGVLSTSCHRVPLAKPPLSVASYSPFNGPLARNEVVQNRSLTAISSVPAPPRVQDRRSFPPPEDNPSISSDSGL